MTATAADKKCTCDPKKLASRGRCAKHGFAADPVFVHRKQLQQMTLRDLLKQLIDLAAVAIDACDGREEPLYNSSEQQRLTVLIEVAKERLLGKRGPR